MGRLSTSKLEDSEEFCEGLFREKDRDREDAVRTVSAMSDLRDSGYGILSRSYSGYSGYDLSESGSERQKDIYGRKVSNVVFI